MFNCRTRLIISFSPIEIVFQRDLRWWSRRQVLSFIQLLSSVQSFNFYNTMGWKCSLKNNCARSFLIEHQSFFDSKINIDSKYFILMFLPCIFANIVRDVVQRSQYILGLCDFNFLDEQERSTQIVFCSNFDLQVPVHC